MRKLIHIKKKRAANVITQAPSMLYWQPAGDEATINGGWTAVPKATTYEVWVSTDGTNYSLGSIEGGTATAQGFSRGQKAYIKVRGKNASGTGPFSSTLFAWTVGAYAFNYFVNALVGDAQNQEYAWLDIIIEDFDINGPRPGKLDNFMPISPTASAAGDNTLALYDVTIDSFQGDFTNVVNSDGVYFNNDSYIEVSPAIGSGTVNETKFMINIFVNTLKVPTGLGYANYESIYGCSDGGSKFFRMDAYKTGGGSSTVRFTSGDSTSFAEKSITSSFTGLISAGCGGDEAPSNTLWIDTTGTPTLGAVFSGAAPTEAASLGAYESGGAPFKMSGYNLQWFTSTGTDYDSTHLANVQTWAAWWQTINGR